MDTHQPLPSTPSVPLNGRWMALLLVGEAAPTPPGPRGPPSPVPAPYWEGTCPSCRRHVRLWRAGGREQTNSHDPGCPYQGEPARLRQAWGDPEPSSP